MQAEPQLSTQRTLADYVAIMRRRKWIVILPLLVVPLFAYVYSARQPERFAASAEIWINRQDVATSITGVTNPDLFTDPSRFDQTQADLARVPEVAIRAVARSGVRGATAGELLANSSVRPHGNADLLTFTVESGDPLVAAKLVSAYAHAFTFYRLQLATASLASARADLESNLRGLDKRGLSNTQLYNDLVRKSQELRTLELLQTKPTVVRQADDAAKIAPTPRHSAMLGLAFGLLLGISAAFLWEALDKRVRDEAEIEAALGVPLLARLPAPRQTREGQDRLAMLDEPSELEAESVRRLRTNFEFANLDLKAKIIMVTSAVAEEGKSLALANLAVALARSGRRVALVDLDLRRPSVGRLFGLGPAPGVTDVAIKHAELDDALVTVPLKSVQAKPGATVPSALRVPREFSITVEARGELHVLSAGSTLSSPAEFLGTSAVRGILGDLRDQMDIVLVDAPPLLAVIDAAILSGHVDAMLVVVRLGRVNKPSLHELSRELNTCLAPRLGFILTGSDPSEFYGAYAYIDKAEAGREKVRRRLAPAPVPAPPPAPARVADEDEERTRRWA